MIRIAATLLCLALGSAFAGEQLIVSIAPGWNSSTGKLQRFERDGKKWTPVGQPVRVLYGKNGLAWGRGLQIGDSPAPHKVERDKRAPAGVFAIGKIYTFDQSLPEGANYPFRTVSQWDAWVDDVANPLYNKHVVVDPNNVPAWFEKQKMRHNDPPHRWLIEIRHNADPPVAGAGSAIFFHIQRGPDRTSAGCTVMPQQDIVSIVRWLRADDDPRYVLLPREEYLALWKKWNLPSPEEAQALL